MLKEIRAERMGACPNGKDIDEYLNGTICGAEEDLEEDILAPQDGNYEVTEPEEPEMDDRYKEFL